jgi:hypothetical protein
VHAGSDYSGGLNRHCSLMSSSRFKTEKWEGKSNV